MKKLIFKLVLNQWKKASEENDKNILGLLDKNSTAKILDCGCNDGSKTLQLGKKMGTKHLYGVDVVDERIKSAKKKGINVQKGDLNSSLKFKDDFFDVVHANQVIEHLTNIDNFVMEISRMLKLKGYAIISTENLSAFDNLIALFLGQQAFSQHISERYHLGNRFSPHYKEKIDLKSWSHKIIFTYYGLQNLFTFYGFRIDKIKVSGYFPLPNFISKLDPIHAHFITIKARKVKNIENE